MSAERLDGIVRALGRTLTLREPPATADALASLLDALELDPRDRAALLAIGPKRLLTYRALVHGTLAHAIRRQLELTAGVLGDGRFDEEVATYFASGMPASHYLLDVAFEFFDGAKDRWSADASLPPFLSDLARFELLDYESSASRRPPLASPIEDALELDRPVVLDESVRIGRYAYPVQRFEPGVISLDPEPTAILVYRAKSFDIEHVELTPLAAEMLDRLVAGATLKAAVESAGAALHATYDLEDVARFLADLAERGVLLGSVTS